MVNSTSPVVLVLAYDNVIYDKELLGVIYEGAHFLKELSQPSVEELFHVYHFRHIISGIPWATPCPILS
jgi:hypothetical protein